MALDKATLKSDIETIMNSLKDFDGSEGKTQTDAITKFAEDLSNAIDTYVKTASVSTTVASGIAVQVTPSTGTGATTATGNGSGSLS